MNKEFILAGQGYDWLSWVGQWPLYDGGLFVNRTIEEHTWSGYFPGYHK